VSVPAREAVRAGSPAGIDGRLAQAAETGETLELILVLRGRVRRAPRAGRWRMRMSGGGFVTFTAETVVAATAVPRIPRR
jgi:hypothetical protein